MSIIGDRRVLFAFVSPRRTPGGVFVAGDRRRNPRSFSLLTLCLDGCCSHAGLLKERKNGRIIEGIFGRNGDAGYNCFGLLALRYGGYPRCIYRL